MKAEVNPTKVSEALKTHMSKNHLVTFLVKLHLGLKRPARGTTGQGMELGSASKK